MGMTKIASRVSPKTFSASGSGGALTVASGEPVTVYGIVLKSVSASTFTIAKGAGTAIFDYYLAATASDTIFICWKADAGISVQSSSGDGSCAVFHDNPGN